MLKNRILVVGSTAFDLLLHHEGGFPDALAHQDLEHLSVSYLTPHFARHHGGTAANIAWNIRLLGGTPTMLSTVGSDGASYISLLSERGIDTTLIDTVLDKVTAMAIIATDSAERQITFFHSGADGVGKHPDISALQDDVSVSIISPRNPVLMLQAAQDFSSRNIPYLFDPGQVAGAFSRDEFRRAIAGSAGLIVNEYEWGIASKILEWSENDAVKNCGLLLITLGEHGVRYLDTDGERTIRACSPDRIVNPVGAGDAFRAGFLVGRSLQWSTTDACKLGAGIASFIVEQEGSLLESLDLGILSSRMCSAYGNDAPRLP